jgi:hypothetical protein
MATQFSENGIFCGKFPVFEKNKFAKMRQKTGFGGGGNGVATFMPTGEVFRVS